MSMQTFHSSVQTWFSKTFKVPTGVQNQAWDSIVQGQHTLLAAPTGSGKTLAAFLGAIDALIKEGLKKNCPIKHMYFMSHHLKLYPTTYK